MTDAGLLLAAGGVAALVALATDRAPVLRMAGAIAAAFALASAVRAGAGGVLIILAAALLLLNLGHLALLLLARQRARFSEEEERMVAHGLAGLDRAQARHLLDQGMWIDGKPGEVLTRENQPVSHLFYLSAGAAQVTNGGRWIATVGAPTFFGEITVLDESGATATVTLEGEGRFWCVPAGELRLFLRENPALRGALENCFIGTLTQKLRAANRVIGGGVRAPHAG